MDRVPVLKIGDILLVPIQTDLVDSFVGRTLSTIAAVSRVLDAETVVVGMRPAVAITLVELGLSLPGVRTALNVELGMELLARTRRTGAAEPAGDDKDVPAPAVS